MLETRQSLLQRVRDPANTSAWSEFVVLYKPLLMAYVRKRGVSEHDDADDVVQDVFTRLVPAMARFEFNPDRGRFRTWLWQVTHSTLVDWARRRAVQGRAENNWATNQEAERPGSPDVEWSRLYRNRVLEVVIQRVRKSTQEASWACFEQRILGGRPAAEVASELGLSTNAVYVNASRILAKIREQCAEFSEMLGSA
jgi:RNA polymerase sigma-70 factor (ECF subfamily)